MGEANRLAEQLGDTPIEQRFRLQMNAVAAGLDSVLNGKTKGNDREVGFVLLVFPFGETEGRCNYISNGASRDDIVVMFKEMIARFEGQPDLSGTA